MESDLSALSAKSEDKDWAQYLNHSANQKQPGATRLFLPFSSPRYV
jgi:hypothetical protein